MANDQQAALRELLRHNLFGNRADGPFSLKAKAWACRLPMHSKNVIL
jgi:hypothetical protein